MLTVLENQFYTLRGTMWWLLPSSENSGEKNYFTTVREAAKKTVPPLMARPLRPYPPPPSNLMAMGTFFSFFSIK